MSIQLRNLLKDRTPERIEENLQQGVVYVFSQGTMYQFFRQGICWIAPADGCVVIEAWGAGGSGAEMCCCGFGIPGNAGGYARKCITMTAGQFITGCTGMSCGNSDDLCFRGCSAATGLTWNGVALSDGATTGCLCAQGGKGGVSYCSTTPSAYCCFTAGGFCTTRTSGDNCGIVCNYCQNGTTWIACGYGGDVNCCGGISCTSFFGCYPSCPCQTYNHIAQAPNMFSCGGVSHTAHRQEDDNRFSRWSGGGERAAINAQAGMSKSPSRGIPMSYCWRSDRSCGCYNMTGCMPNQPIGAGGRPPFPCPDVRDHGGRGGHGGIRIRFIQT